MFHQQENTNKQLQQRSWEYHVQVDGEEIERVGGSSALDLFEAAEETDGHSRASRHGGVGPMRTVAAKLMRAGEQDENKTREWPPTLLFVSQMPQTQVQNEGQGQEMPPRKLSQGKRTVGWGK